MNNYVVDALLEVKFGDHVTAFRGWNWLFEKKLKILNPNLGQEQHFETDNSYPSADRSNSGLAQQCELNW